MNRQGKQSVVESLKKDFNENQGSFLVGIKGMTVEELRSLRKGVANHGGKIQVIKNTLMKVAVKDMQGISDLTPYFKEQVALVFASNEVPAVAKVLHNFSKTNEKLIVVAGCLNSKVMSKDRVKVLASLPSREVQLAILCGTLKAPITKLAVALNALAQQKTASENVNINS